MINKIPKSFLMYIMIGSINTVVHQSVYLTMLNTLNPYQANALGFSLSILVSFCLNTKYTFSSTMSLEKFVKFPLSYIPHIIGSTIGLGILIEGFHVPARFASILTVIIVGPIAYLIAKNVLTKETELKQYRF